MEGAPARRRQVEYAKVRGRTELEREIRGTSADLRQFDDLLAKLGRVRWAGLGIGDSLIRKVQVSTEKGQLHGFRSTLASNTGWERRSTPSAACRRVSSGR